MITYSLRKENLKYLLIKLMPLSLINLLYPIFLYFALTSSLKDLPVLGIFKLIFFALFIFNIIREAIKILRIRRDWMSFEINISNDSISKSQFKTPTLKIQFEDIKRIVEISGGVSIQTIISEKFIFIPKEINYYEELKKELIRIQPIEVSPINSINVQSQYALSQHIKPGSILKKLFITIGIGFGVLLLFFLVIIGLLTFLAT